MKILKYHPPPGRLLAIACVCAAVLFGGANLAQAGPLTGANMMIFDDGAPVAYVPMSKGSSGKWELDAFGSSTDFAFSIVAKSNQPGTAANANIQLIAIVTDTATDGKAHMLSIQFSDTAFKMPSGSMATLFSSGSITYTGTTTSDKASFQSWANTSDVLFGKGVTTGLQSSTSPGGEETVSGVFTPNPTSKGFTRTGDFSLFQEFDITLNEEDASAQFSGSSVVTAVPDVPEPATMTLLGIGLAGMGVYGWRKRRRN